MPDDMSEDWNWKDGLTSMKLKPWYELLDGEFWPFVNVVYEYDGETYDGVVGLFNEPAALTRSPGDLPQLVRFDELFVMYYAKEDELVELIGKTGEFADATLLEIRDRVEPISTADKLHLKLMRHFVTTKTRSWKENRR